jgi:hypothetical protein
MRDDILRYDADLAPIGDRVASSGWPLLPGVRLIRADASGVTVFPGGIVAYGAPHVTMGVVINGQAMEGRPLVLDDDELVGEGPIAGVVEPRRAVLDDFLRLNVDPSDAAILAYARRYGLLGLAPAERRVVPEGRRELFADPRVPWVGEQLAPTLGYRHAPGVLREPLRLWRRVIAEIAAVYAVAGHLRLDQVVEREVWAPLAGILELPLGADETVDGAVPEEAPEEAPAGSRATVPWIPIDPTSLEGQRQALVAVIGTWLALGAVRPVIAWGQPRRDEPVVTLGVTTLFGGLVLELLLAAGGTAGFAICSGCGLPYVPRRRPPGGSFAAPRATYCPTCQARGLPQLAAARRWRATHPDYYRDRRRRGRAPGSPDA